MVTWNFSGTPSYNNGTFSGKIHFGDLGYGNYQISYRVQMFDGTTYTVKYIDGQIVNNGTVGNTGVLYQIDVNFSQYIGVPITNIKFIDLALTVPSSRPSPATGQRQAILNLLHWEPSGMTSSIQVGRLPINPATGLYGDTYYPNTSILIPQTTTPINQNPQIPTMSVVPPTSPNLPSSTMPQYWHFTVRLPNNIKDFIITYDTLTRLLNLNWGSIQVRYEPLIGALPSYVGISSFNDVANFAGLNTTLPPTGGGQPPSGGQQPTTGNTGGFGASIFGIILGIAAVGSLIPSGVRKLRRRHKKK